MHTIRPKLERMQYAGTRSSTIMGYQAQIYQIEIPSYKCIVTLTPSLEHNFSCAYPTIHHTK